jgi:hypothetical protein
VSARAASWLLWAGALAMLPLPLLGLQTGRVPVGRMLELGAVCVAVMAAETTRGVGPLLALGFGLQALLWASLLLWLCRRAEAPLGRLAPRVRAALAVGVLAAAALAAATAPVYRTPYAATSMRATLLEVYR